MVSEGRLTSQEAAAVMQAAHEVAADVDADRRWWSRWGDWSPHTQIM